MWNNIPIICTIQLLEKIERWMRDTLVFSFSSCSHVHSHAKDVYVRTCVHVPRGFVRTCTYCNYAIPASYVRRATDSNSVYCSPFAVTFLTYFHFRRDDTVRKHRKACEKTRRELRDQESLAISRRRLSQESRRSRIFGFSKTLYHNSHCFRHKNVKMACSRNDDVSNFALYILTDVTLLS